MNANKQKNSLCELGSTGEAIGKKNRQSHSTTPSPDRQLFALHRVLCCPDTPAIAWAVEDALENFTRSLILSGIVQQDDPRLPDLTRATWLRLARASYTPQSLAAQIEVSLLGGNNGNF